MERWNRRLAPLALLAALLAGCAGTQDDGGRWDGGTWNSVLGYHGPTSAQIAGGP